MAAADRQAVLDLVIGEHRTEGRAPVHGRFALVGDPPVHQRLALFGFAEGFPLVGREGHRFAAGRIDPVGSRLLESGDQLADRTGLAQTVVIIRIEHLQEGPLGPFVIFRIAGAELAVPVVGETDTVQLFPIARDILVGRHFRVLAGLDGILLRREAEGIIPHRMQDVEALETLVTREDVAGDVSQRMPDMQAGPGGIREHVQDIKLRFGSILPGPEGLLRRPTGLPLLLDFSEIVFHMCLFISLFRNCLSSSAPI